MMVLPLISALGGGSGIGGLLGGIFGKKKKAPGTDFTALRNDAQAAGFNPLTALMATGAAGYQRESSPSLSAGAYLAEAIGRGVDTAFSRPPKSDLEADRIRRLDDFKQQRQASRVADPTQRFGFALTDAAPFGAQVKTSPPALASGGLIGPRKPVRVRDAVSGVWLDLDASVADRLQIQSGGVILAEDREAIYGDLLSEADSAAGFGLGIVNGYKGPIYSAPSKPKPPVLPPKKPYRAFGLGFGGVP